MRFIGFTAGIVWKSFVFFEVTTNIHECDPSVGSEQLFREDLSDNITLIVRDSGMNRQWNMQVPIAIKI